MDFVLLILLTAVMLIRPEEISPDIAGLRLYLCTIAATTMAAFPKLLAVLTPEAIRTRPITVCVLGTLLSVLLSLTIRGRPDDGMDATGEFAKVVLFFLLLIAIVDTPSRFRIFVGWQIALILVLTAMALGHYHELVYFDGLDPVMQREYDPELGVDVWIPRLVSAGMFNDPNDLCLVLVFGTLCCLYRGFTADSVVQKILWLAPIVPFFYAIMLTHSRGGLLGLIGGLVAGLYGRFGWRGGVALAALGVPLLLVAVGGRQGDMSGGGTAHERVMLWAYGLGDLFRMPIYIPTGLGVGYYPEEYCLVAHNSFINAYVEQGLLGGGLFVVAFYSAIMMANAVGKVAPAEEWAGPARTFILAVAAGYAVGVYSVSRNTVLPTYLVLGLCATYVNMALPVIPSQHYVDGAWFRRAAIMSACGLVFLKYFTQGAGILGV